MLSHRPGRLLRLLPLATLLFAGTAQAITLKIATVMPAGTDFIAELRSAGETIAERTDDRVQLKLFPGGVMGNASSVLRKMKIGQLHGAIVTASGLTEIHPDAQVYSMPFVFRNREEIEYVRERIDPVLRERLRSEGYVLAGLAEGGFTYLFSQKPITRMEDLAERKVWVPKGDEVTARMFKNAGSQPISLPVSDVFTSLQTGLIDTVTISPTGAISLQWHTGVNYQTDAPLLFLVAMMVLDERVFERIDGPDQKVVQAELRKTFDRLDEINARNDREAMKALRGQEIELVQPERVASKRRWKEVAATTLDELEQEGKYDWSLLERVRGLVEAYREQHGG